MSADFSPSYLIRIGDIQDVIDCKFSPTRATYAESLLSEAMLSTPTSTLHIREHNKNAPIRVKVGLWN